MLPYEYVSCTTISQSLILFVSLHSPFFSLFLNIHQAKLGFLKGFDIFFNIYIYFVCNGSSLLHVGFLQLQRAAATLQLQCTGFLLWWLLLLQEHRFQGTLASVVSAHGLRGCGTQAQLPHGMQDLARKGIKPVSSALQGGFLTTGPPGKPFIYLFKLEIIREIWCFHAVHLNLKKNIKAANL